MVDALTIIRGLLLLTGLFLLGLAVWIHHQRDAPALRPFVALVATIGLIATADGLAAENLTALSIVWITALIAIPSVFTWFVVEYYGLPHLASPLRKAVFIAPAIAGIVGGAALVLAPNASGSMAGGVAPAMPAPLGFAHIA
ncbi:MAG: hypothetical protein ABEH64_07180, partial [Salinirussus sp.]